MKNLLLFFLIGISMSAFGQSKKEQLLIFTSRLDSLNKEHSTLSIQYAEAQEQIREKSNTITSLNSKNKDLKNEIEEIRKLQKEQIALLTYRLDSINQEKIKEEEKNSLTKHYTLLEVQFRKLLKSDFSINKSLAEQFYNDVNLFAKEYRLSKTQLEDIKKESMKNDNLNFDENTMSMYREGKLFTGRTTDREAGGYYEANYTEGKLHGLSIGWGNNGQLRNIINYKDGVGNPIAGWWDNGSLEEMTNCSGDPSKVMEGLKIKGSEDGQLRYVLSYKNGEKIDGFEGGGRAPSE